MAVRDTDTALWLHNKLGSTDDLWSGRSICSQLTRERLHNIRECFYNLQPYVKVKLMLAFFHIPKRNIEEWRMELEEILELAINDTDQWVSMVGDILRTFPSHGTLNMEVDDSVPYFHEVLSDLRKLVRKSTDANMLPLECLFLSRAALNSVAGQQGQSTKHFALKRKPKSASLRAEILQKSSEVASLRKHTNAISLPIKVRSFAKRMDDKTPLKGLPSNTPTTGGFRTPGGTTRERFASGGTPLSHRPSPASRREGGIKLLDITEQPVGGKEAKRRRKQQEMEEQQRKEKEAAAAANTPDYAAGLLSPAVGNLNMPATPGTPTTQPSYAPPTGLTATSLGTPVSSLPGSTSLASQQARQNLQQHLQQQLVTTTQASTAMPAATTIVITTSQPGQSSQQQGAAQVTPAPATVKRGLSLTRDQMLEAQEMFRNSNKVTRPEKALILGFMAGSRENPCPDQGEVVNIRLSENLDSIQQPDGTFRPMIVDTYFQMNYASGEWKRVKKYRQPDE